MKRARSWVLTVALSCFAAGIAVGLVAPDAVKAMSAEESQDADDEFIARFTEDYELTAEQVEELRMILVARQEEEMRQFSSFGHDNLPQVLQDSLERVHKKADRRIQVILDEEQKKHFQEELDKKGDPWPRP